MGRTHLPGILLALALSLGMALDATRAGAETQASIFEYVGRFGGMIDWDMSPRGYAMGSASGAVFWGEALDVRRNPALLGYESGVRYEQGARTILDEWPKARTRHATIGQDGVGILLAGQPHEALGGITFEQSMRGTTAYGSFELSDHHSVRSWGAGVSAAEVARTLARRGHREAPALMRHADLAIGYAENVETNSMGDIAGPLLESRYVTQDVGLLVRAGNEWRLGDDGAAKLLTEIAYGLTVQLRRDGQTPSHRRHALAGRLTQPAPARWRAKLPSWLAPMLDPVFSLGASYDHDRKWLEGWSRNTNLTGVELGLTHVLALQFAPRDEAGQRWGVTVALPVGRFAEARYQHAADDDGLIHYDAWSVRIEPFALARALR